MLFIIIFGTLSFPTARILHRTCSENGEYGTWFQQHRVWVRKPGGEHGKHWCNVWERVQAIKMNSRWTHESVGFLWPRLRSLQLLHFLLLTITSTTTNLHIHTASNWGGSVAKWFACWTQAQKGPGSNRSRNIVGKQSYCLRQTVHTHCASVHQAA